MIVVITSWAPTVAFRKPAIPAQTAPAAAAPATASRMCAGRRHVDERDADPVREIEADQVLAVAADVEHAAAEGEGDGEAGQDQRRRLQQRLAEVVGGRVGDVGVRRVREPVQAGAVEDVPVGLDRVVAGAEDEEAADQESERAP